MALTSSTMLALKTPAIEFELPDVISGNLLSLSSACFGKKGSVLMFICNHCPYVKHVQPELIKLANEYLPKDIAFIAISSNDVGTYPEDGPDQMLAEAKKWGYPFPYLYDESQIVAKQYKVACTPDFYLFNATQELVYRGELDGSRPGNEVPLNGSSLRTALNNLLSGIPIDENQKPSVGCSIKWKY